MSFYNFIFKYVENKLKKTAIIDSELNAYSYEAFHKKIIETEKLYVENQLAAGSILILHCDKSFMSLVHLFCCIKLGIVYIPVDIDCPKDRLKRIIESSNPNAIVTPDLSVRKFNNNKHNIDSDALCVLYTSGSTGQPKGVVCSKTGIEVFVKWSIEEFNIREEDTLTAFAPYHFDLSTFDLFASMATGASVWLLDKKIGSNFRLIGDQIQTINPTIWYATPTVYKLLLQHGDLPTTYSPRITLFAGEVFPINQLNSLRTKWNKSLFYNLYGPTETNVCSFYKLPNNIDFDRNDPYPIGVNCPFAQLKIENGELLVGGDSLMLGYLNDEKSTSNKFKIDGSTKWLKTGDLVDLKDNLLHYRGRNDRMVKRNGFRIELGEIENALNQHPNIFTAACIHVTNKHQEVNIIAYYQGEQISTMKLKRYCHEKLLSYMVPNKFVCLDNIPTNSNGKVDFNQLINNFNLHE